MRTALVVLAALCVLVLAPGAAQAATTSNTFTGTSNDWNTGSNWSQGSVPDATDDVVIPTTKLAILSLGADGAANSITVDAGAVLYVRSTRVLAVGSGASSIAGDLGVNDDGSKLTLAGTTTWSAGRLDVGGRSTPTDSAGGTVENAGTLNITGDVTGSDFGSGKLHNLSGAQVNRTTSTGVATLNTPLDNDGAVSVATGELQLNRGTIPGEQSGGTFSAAGGMRLALAGDHNVGGTGSAISGPGAVRFDGGTTSVAATTTYDPANTRTSGGFLALAGTGSTTGLTSSGGGMSGTGTLNVGTGSSNLNGITFKNTGTTSFAAGGTRFATGTVNVQDAGTTLRLGGTTDWASGTWNVGGSATTGPPPGGTVENAGTLNLTGSNLTASNLGNGKLKNVSGAQLARQTNVGVATIGVPLDNDGVVSAGASELQLNGGTIAGEQSGGTFSAGTPAGTLALAGDHNVGGTGSSIEGQGRIRLDFPGTTSLASTATYSTANTVVSGGSLALAGTGTTTALTSDGEGGGISGTGTLNVGAGASNLNNVTFKNGGTTTFAAFGTTAANGDVSVQDAGTTLRLNGTMNWSAGNWSVGGTSPGSTSPSSIGGTVENAGTLNVTGSGHASNFGNGRFRNLAGATLQRTTSSTSAEIEVPLDNDGAVSVAAGELLLSDGTIASEQSGGTFSAAASTTLGLAGFHEVGGTGSAIGGAGTVRLRDFGTASLAASTTYNPAKTFVSGGSLALAGTGTTSSLISDGQGGGMSGTGTLNVTGTSSNLDNITFSNTGTTSFAAGGTTAATGPVNVRDAGTTLRLGGTTTWSAGTWSAGGASSTSSFGGAIENAGTLNITGNVSGSQATGGGKLRNLSGAQLNQQSGAAVIGLPFDNDGAVSVATGSELQLSAGTIASEQSGGTFSISGGLTLAGNHNVGGTGSAIGGTGIIFLAGGTTSVAATATYNPTNTVAGGGFLALAGTGTTGALSSAGGGGMSGTGTLNVGTGASSLNGITFKNSGTTSFAAGGTAVATGPVNVRDEGTILRLGGTTFWSADNWSVGGTSSTSSEGGMVENAGTLNVTGNGSASQNGNGKLKNLSGAQLSRQTSTGTATIGVPTENAGTLNVNTGTLRFSAPSPSLSQTAGTTEVRSGATLDVDNSLALSGGELKGAGTVDGSVSNTGGTVAPGGSPGILKITGDYTQDAGGTLKTEVDGSIVGSQYDQLDVSGSATLGGTLDIDNGSGHDPSGSATFKIVKSQARSGAFSTVTGVEISSTKRYTVNHDTDGVTLGVEVDPAPDVSIGNATVTEGDSGTRTATFTVTRSSTSGGDTTVGYSTADGSATNGSDYGAKSGTVTFTGADTEKDVTIDVTGDTRDESDEDFLVNLSSSQNATITDGQGKGTITDDDPAPQLSIDDVTVTREGNSGVRNASFKVRLSAASGRPVSVGFATANGTAKAPGDYVRQTAGTVNFAAGDTEKTVAVQVKGDTLDEANETFSVALSNPQNATILDGTGSGRITDDDAPPRLSVGDVSLAEGNAGVRAASFRVSLSAVSGRSVTVGFATANGTARAPGDYSARSGTLTFSPGQRTKSVAVSLKGERLKEANETFLLNLSRPTNAGIFDSRGVGTIRNDD